MKTTIICLLLIASVFTQDMNEIRDLFETWKLEQGKEYESYEEDALRLNVFARNYMYVKAWNDAGNTATLALNQFADLSSEEFGAMYTGAKPASKKVVEANIVDFDDEASYPSDWDWRTQGAVTPIKNQGQCGGCWAFATVASVEGLYEINGNPLTSFSEAQIIDCDTTGGLGCGGGYPYKAIQYVEKYGLETEAEYPFTGSATKCAYNASLAIKTGVTGAAYVTPKNAQDLYAAVYQQPIIILVEADQTAFQLYSSGVITSGCGVALDHAITAVGYTDDYFIVKNSWGTTWGQEGYVYISSSTEYNKGLGACGIFTQPQYPTGVDQ